MVVTVYLHTTLQRHTSQGLVRKLPVNLPLGSSMADLLHGLEIDLAAEALLLVVNGRTAEVDQILSDGDEVHLVPALSGG